MTKELTRSEIGAWLFKCNPLTWDIESALRDGRRIDRWRVKETYRLNLISAGDPAVVWVTGSKGAIPTPGIRAIGYTTGETLGADPHDGYWLQPRVGDADATYTGLLVWPIETVARDTIASILALDDLEIIRQAQMPNPSYLTPSQFRALVDLVGPWPAFT